MLNRPDHRVLVKEVVLESCLLFEYIIVHSHCKRVMHRSISLRRAELDRSSLSSFNLKAILVDVLQIRLSAMNNSSFLQCVLG